MSGWSRSVTPFCLGSWEGESRFQISNSLYCASFCFHPGEIREYLPRPTCSAWQNNASISKDVHVLMDHDLELVNMLPYEAKGTLKVE